MKATLENILRAYTHVVEANTMALLLKGTTELVDKAHELGFDNSNDTVAYVMTQSIAAITDRAKEALNKHDELLKVLQSIEDLESISVELPDIKEEETDGKNGSSVSGNDSGRNEL